ncbi:Adaptor protein complex 4 (AP-4), sigma subunitB [Monocercomonoides exilis]|uniref:Adaptor protein complex 4 (AP-4), sigma subunitB n=1 Tax=Monocercomonoides exilis TaxID=2049356 RepID=UPI00355A0462|nr:Adaptor protein complex 4 (AP-4), sigma subunitB [Monocercomonoides exilis]|eukprot:MONOS_10990.1-p1 / transcript=MONOS_10990.1 / gene=MONOS_10990 / organism=Monocercomonoides_exilis_PA203 / gene_product= Adaptor protein complex 4 (AP-4), sigma subunit B / transcript_product= Adaptor protein complex 4 (AP-4), sigma subunit B / location=Mono_scaffold00525:43612-44205(-) / protein_length=144 / sequence_SO=supercontig / SO=protein_coding / is_pseudo=false
MIQFFLIVNKFGETRLSQYYESIPLNERIALEGEVVRKCVSRPDGAVPFFNFEKYTVFHKRYASLYVIVGTTDEENELEIIEFIHLFVETLDEYFENVCEFDVMMNLDRVHFIVNEMIANGHIIGTEKTEILEPIEYLDKLCP